MKADGAPLFLRVLEKVDAWLGAALLVLIPIALIADMVCRWWLSHSFFIVHKLALYGAISVCLLGVGSASSYGKHIRPRLFDRLIPQSIVPGLCRFGDALSALVFLAAGCVASFYVWQNYEAGFFIPVVDWSLWVVQLALPYAFFSTAMRHYAFWRYPAIRVWRLQEHGG